MQITGKLGEVMQESVKAAKSYVRSKSLEFGIIPPVFEKKDFHIHVPEGATPKDGTVSWYCCGYINYIFDNRQSS
jgi:ATP-dependent Lon protease